MAGERTRQAQQRNRRNGSRFPGTASPPAGSSGEHEELAVGRRGFLKAAGFGLMLAGCRQAPLEKAIPFLIPPEEIVPGRSLYYASTCTACPAACGLLAKTRDGRPIKLEGNPAHPLSRGALCALGQASILGLYDKWRPRNPRHQGQDTSWEQIDAQIMERLEGLRRGGGALRLLTGTLNSPALEAVVKRFLAGFPDARRISYDPVSRSAILDAHLQTHGKRVLPRYRFDRAEVILSFDADFLGTWISPVEHTAGYREARSPDVETPRRCYHVQVESRLSLTGSKADRRIVAAPHEHGPLAVQLAAALADLAGESFPGEVQRNEGLAQRVEPLARMLWRARRRSLVVSGSPDPAFQTACNYLNELLGNYGRTLELGPASRQREGDDGALAGLLEELGRGEVGALLVWGVDPVFELPLEGRWETLLEQVPLMISLDDRLTETCGLADYFCPDHHYLESWGDREPVEGVLSLLQPCIEPLGRTRPLIESLSAWMGDSRPAYELLREHWRSALFPRQRQETSFDAFWDRALHDGVAQIEPESRSFSEARFEPRMFGDGSREVSPAEGEFSLVLYPKVGVLDGRHADNPWLQELPDPISKATWGNYACLAPLAAEAIGVREGDLIRLGAVAGQGPELELPVLVQPGQHERVVAVALGYGGKATRRFAGIGPRWLEAGETVGNDGRVGVNSAPFIRLQARHLVYSGVPVRLSPTGERRQLARTQLYDAITVPASLALPGGERRPAVKEVTWEELFDPHLPVEPGTHSEHGSSQDLWPDDHPYTGRRWAMTIDLDACTGCSACVIACQVENNIPVVGRDEVRRQREMHWLRIDRYYWGQGENLRVAHQPMPCQHCQNAPCETVCPVLATVHSAEGLNQQVYNRCVGTRYCANNCPYKVRRFNWFDYAHEDELENLVLNPDVTVRSRGVMEKCSFCVQRIQEAKIEAKRRGVELRDGEIQSACQQTCPASAIVFGNINDAGSRVAQLAQSARHYRVLEELNVKPAVAYLKLVSRPDPQEEGHG